MAVLTQIDFWHPRGGDRSRIGALLAALSRQVQLTLLCPTTLGQPAHQALAMHWPNLHVQVLNLPQQGSTVLARQEVRAFFTAHPHDACIFEFLSMGWLRSAVPPGVLTLIDTHDVTSQRDADLAVLPDSANRVLLTPDREAEQLRAFDRVTVICQPDAAVFTGWVGAERVLVVPHAQVLRPRSLRGVAQRLLFVGSFYGPNMALPATRRSAWLRPLKTLRLR